MRGLLTTGMVLLPAALAFWAVVSGVLVPRGSARRAERAQRELQAREDARINAIEAARKPSPEIVEIYAERARRRIEGKNEWSLLYLDAVRSASADPAERQAIWFHTNNGIPIEMTRDGKIKPRVPKGPGGSSTAAARADEMESEAKRAAHAARERQREIDAVAFEGDRVFGPRTREVMEKHFGPRRPMPSSPPGMSHADLGCPDCERVDREWS